MSDRRVSVNIIRIFEGPRHARLEAIWRWFANCHANQMDFHVFDNRKLQLSHADAYARIWDHEMRRPNQFTILTEFDFLPGANFLDVKPMAQPLAAQYCTRDARTLELIKHNLAGAWFVMVDKERTPEPNFRAGGAFNDPCNLLDATLLDTEDCYPRHYGVKVKFDYWARSVGSHKTFDIGEHLFWSRHYNDPPFARPAGFDLGAIQAGVDRAIEEYVK